MTEGEAGPPDTSVPEHSHTPSCLSEKKPPPPHSYTLGSILISPYEKRQRKEEKKRQKRKQFSNLEGAWD